MFTQQLPNTKPRQLGVARVYVADQDPRESNSQMTDRPHPSRLATFVLRIHVHVHAYPGAHEHPGSSLLEYFVQKNRNNFAIYVVALFILELFSWPVLALILQTIVYYAPINVKPHYPPPPRVGGFGRGILLENPQRG